MGGSVVYLDSNVFIDLIAGRDELKEPSILPFQTIRSRNSAVVTSELTFAEVLSSGTERALPPEIHDAYVDLLANSGLVVLVPVSREILVQSARLRSDRSMRLPDAVHAATALASSRDRRIRALPDGLERKEVQPDAIDLIGRILDTA